MNDSFDNEIKNAFDSMSPDEEAQKRMLENILKGTESAKEKPQDSSAKPIIKPKTWWYRILPIAASLLVLAGVGIFAFSLTEPNTYSPSNKSASENVASENTYSESPDPTDTYDDAPQSSIAVPQDYAQQYPLILPDTVNEGEYGELVIVNDTPIDREQSFPIIDTSTAYAGKAYSEDKTESIDCTIYGCATGLPYCAVQYEGSEDYYLALPKEYVKK